jgi:hypothetical protein
MLLAAVVWLFGVFVTQWHELVVPHARCPEHGELIEIVVAEPGDGPELVEAPDDPHHDGCALHAAPSAGPAVLQLRLPAPPAPPGEACAPWESAALVLATLSFAPKTSPPTFA